MDNIALEFKDVTGKGFGFKLKNVSMTLENGYIYAVTGKNGAGKTTLFNYILTEKKRYTGSIKLSGYELAGNHAKAMLSIPGNITQIVIGLVIGVPIAKILTKYIKSNI